MSQVSDRVRDVDERFYRAQHAEPRSPHRLGIALMLVASVLVSLIVSAAIAPVFVIAIVGVAATGSVGVLLRRR